jgi:tRNA threonylcarbamoyladenosine biosynthesis protein TsaB
MILVIDTATNEAKIALVSDKKVEQISWLGGRELSATIIEKIKELYKKVGGEFTETEGVIVNAGPGSFTGLRIGISVANAWAYGLNVPVVGVDHAETFAEIINSGRDKIRELSNFEKSVEPVYGAEPNITKPKNK